MRASATFFVTATTTCTSCPTLSGEGVCNTASALNGRSFLLSYPLRWGCLQLLLANAGFIFQGCPTLSYEGVCNSYGQQIWLEEQCCPTLSDEGVCNQLKINISKSWTFYLVCSNYLKYNTHIILNWKLRKYTEKFISIMAIFHVFPQFNSPQPNLNLRKMNQRYSMKYTFSKNA